MTGLDLESFLLVLRADLTTWVVLGLATLVLALMVWSCWRSRRALRNCLVLSLAGHLGLVLYGSTIPAVMSTLASERRESLDRTHLRRIRIDPVAGLDSPGGVPRRGEPTRKGASTATTGRFDLATTTPLLPADEPLRVARPTDQDKLSPIRDPEFTVTPLTAVADATPKGNDHAPAAPAPEIRPEPEASTTTAMKGGGNAPPSAVLVPPDLAEVVPVDPAPREPVKIATSARSAVESSLSRDLALASDRRLRPDRVASGAEKKPATGTRSSTPIAKDATKPERDNDDDRPGGKMGEKRDETPAPPLDLTAGGSAASLSIPLARATPGAGRGRGGRNLGLAELGDRGGVNQGQPLTEIPKLYQPRLEPDRSTRAQRIGASAASELAVERALDWLARHQDKDGRWDGGIARYDDGTSVKGDNDFSVHCPRDDPCAGECAYWEADTALTGLALLTFLGAGYTHTDGGRYTAVVGQGLEFLLAQQKPDGDLRGQSQVVGMYCHAMATLAICEACALTGDDRLRKAAERAVNFLVRARARDQMAWRYAPGAPVGDTSILGWVVMVLKSAREVGIAIPADASVRKGTLAWLDKVATGPSKGLARYQPWEPVTPTMTAEAWVCRQFLGIGGLGPASTEAAEFLLSNESDRGKTNVYYWYYATLALYQHGGEPWTKWNAQVRDKIIGLQATTGHKTGSWEPDSSPYGSKGGRIYSTTLAALTLEVYYRYLRLYDEPKLPLEPGARPEAGAAAGARPATATATGRGVSGR